MIRTPHSGQLEILQQKRRFNTVCCGRRWGKTELAQHLLLGVGESDNGALQGYPVAYGAPTYRMLTEVWRELSSILEPVLASKSESEKRMELITGGVIDFWSLDNFDSIRGRKYKRFISDESAMTRYLKEAFSHVIRPTLTDMRGDCFFLSTPKGKNNDFYEFFTTNFPDWARWQMPTASNPFIDPVEIEAARLQLDSLTFEQEYMASFVTNQINAFAYAYDPVKHLGVTEVNPRFELVLSFDFNVDPITCGVYQRIGNKILVHECMALSNSNIYELCDRILVSYPNMLYMVTGDSTGQNRSALSKDNLNYYTVIKNKLSLARGQLKVPTVNPPLAENRVLVNSVLQHQDITINEAKCRPLIFDLEYVSVLPDGSIDKGNRADLTKRADSIDHFRYYLNTFCKDFLKF